jgi:hypothetical protein
MEELFMLKWQKYRVFSVVLMVVLMLSLATTAFAITLGVGRVTQANNKWCWAATAEMIGKFVNNNTSRDQWNIVNYVKGSYVNATASVTETKSAINYALEGAATYTSGSTLSWNDHVSKINNYYPIGAWVDWSNGGSHMMVCAGTKTSGSNDTEYIYIIDPWEFSISDWYIYYNAIQNGADFQSGTGIYVTSFYKN